MLKVGCVVGLLCVAASSNASTCLVIDYPGSGEWSASNLALPNSICIYPDGRTTLEDATEGELYVTFMYLMAFSWETNSWARIEFAYRGLLLGGSGTNIVLCDSQTPFLSPCEEYPCGLAQYGIYGGGHSAVDGTGQPIASAEVVWAPDGYGCGDVAIELYVNSPDINGDLVVNAVDAGFFTSDLYGSYNYRSDFNFDGVINASDAGIFAAAVGASCGP